MKRKRVLVFPCGSEIGLEAARSLASAKEIDLVGASSVQDHGEFAYRQHVGGLPFVDDPAFLPRLNEVIRARSIDYLLPAHDSVVLLAAEAEERGELACRALTSPAATCRIARSKRRTMEALRGVVPTPAVWERLDDVPAWPVFLKPDVGQGSKGTALARDRAEAEFHLARRPDLLVLEHLPGAEYTVDCYTDRRGALLFAGGRERLRVANGISVRTRPVRLPEFADLAARINAALLFRGTWFFQVKRDRDGVLRLMEVAPRIAGAMGLHRCMGVNFPLLHVYEHEGYDVRPLVQTFDAEMDRALAARYRLGISYDDVYLDLDDCLVLDGRVDTRLAAFVHQCIGDGVRVHLVTRHAKDVDESLRAHRLAGLFDSVVHLRNGERKSAHVRPGRSIFIDDSFAERAEVSAALGIPVFAPDAVEALLR